jgi:SnoaL-like protein
VTVDGDEATARANTIAVFALSDSAPATPGERVVNPSPQFGIGSVYRFGARRTADGWRLTSMAMHPIWELGERP